MINNNTPVVGFEQKMLSVASKVIIAADHTKFGRGGVILVAPLSAAHVVATDTGAASVHVAMLRNHDGEVLLA